MDATDELGLGERDFTGPCEHGNRWRQGVSCRACWEYARGREDATREIEAWLRKDGPNGLGSTPATRTMADAIEAGRHKEDA